MTTPTTSEELVTIDQAALRTGRSTKTIRRYLPTETNEAAGKDLLVGATQEGSDKNAPWLIPVSDLVRLGWLADITGAPVGGADAQQALARHRDDKELVRLREELAQYRASDKMKDQLLSERSTELDRLRKNLDKLHRTLDLALGGSRLANVAA
jgi:hypothetical protein